MVMSPASSIALAVHYRVNDTVNSDDHGHACCRLRQMPSIEPLLGLLIFNSISNGRHLQ